MKKLAIVLCALLVFVFGGIGCGEEEITPMPTPTLAPTATATPVPTPTPAAIPLEIAEPENEAVVSAASITVSGSTVPGAVVSVSVDDSVEVVLADEAGNFSVTVALEEGANSIEVVASDQEGNEAVKTLTVINNL